jgi:hypothetical protein
VEYAPRVVERLDEERLETLREWGTGLSSNARDELRAAGKAILMLVDEIDRLEADLWNARAEAKQAAAEPVPADVEPPARERRAPAAEPSQLLAMTLSERLAQSRQAPTEPAT